MKFRFNSKYSTIAAYIVITFTVCLLLVLLFFRLEIFVDQTRKVVKVLAPIIWGAVIAYLLNPIVKCFEKWISKLIGKKKPHPHASRSISIAITAILALSLIVALIAMVVPEILGSLSTFINKFPDYLNDLYNNILDFTDKNPNIGKQVRTWLEEQYENIQETLLSWAESLKPQLDKYLVILKDGFLGFLIGIKDFILGFIVSIYLLYSKENFMAQIKKCFHAVFPEKACNRIFSVGSNANTIFINFLSGKALDSFLIGIICFIAMTILGFPYVLLISCIIGITNMIPFFGPFIGAIPCALLILLTDPPQTIWFIIMIVAIQQFDGNFLGPKILGNSLGLPTFWIMFSIFLGGGLFGFTGMLLGVPFFAVIYSMAQSFIEEKLRKKELPIETSAYLPEPVHEQAKPEKVKVKRNKKEK